MATIEASGVTREVHVETPSRLHFGFTGVGKDGIMKGSAGVALDNPLLRFSLSANTMECSGDCSEDIASFASKAAKRWDVDSNFGAYVKEHIPRHVGFGSGTQMCLGAGMAALQLMGKDANASDLAKDMGRGRRSKVGVHSFIKGGFLLEMNGSSASMPVPAQWRFVIAVPKGHTKIYGSDERIRLSRVERTEHNPVLFDSLRQAAEDMAAGIRAEDIALFGDSITRMDMATGEAFSSVQNGLYTNLMVEEGLRIARKKGASGGGQSSWGPGFFTVAPDECTAREIAIELALYMESNRGGSVYCAQVRNQGARLWTIE